MATRTDDATNTSPTDPAQHLKLIDDYDWSADEEFQEGLLAILSPDLDPAQAEHLTLRARCFYYSRKYRVPVDFKNYLAMRAEKDDMSRAFDVEGDSHATASTTSDSRTYEALRPLHLSSSIDEPSRSNAPPPDLTELPSGDGPAAPYPTSFSDIVELISSGKPIPGIRQVPDTVLDGQSSSAGKGARRKPWERETIVKE